jgi:hypothetical protein
MRINCTWCGNTGTVNGGWCPICRPNGPGRLDTWTRVRARHTRRHRP